MTLKINGERMPAKYAEFFRAQGWLPLRWGSFYRIEYDPACRSPVVTGVFEASPGREGGTDIHRRVVRRECQAVQYASQRDYDGLVGSCSRRPGPYEGGKND